LGDFEQARLQAWERADEAGRRVLEAWQVHARNLQQQFAID
jgi:exodeoxyribonuclease-1